MPSSGNTVSKSSHKRRKASINFIPKSRKKGTVPSTTSIAINGGKSDFIDDKGKDNGSELSAQEKREESNQIKEFHQDTLSSIAGNSNTPETSLYVSPKVREESGMGIENGLQAQTDKHFIQQQVQLLATAFTLQDCPGLTAGKRKRKNSIPHDVIDDALRKLHHKMDDEIQKHLNRQCQRKVLSELLEIEKDTAVYENRGQSLGESYITDTMSVFEILEKCSKEDDGETDSDLLRKYSKSKAELQKLQDGFDKLKQEIASYESSNLMVLEVQRLASETTQQSLLKEIQRTNNLVTQVTSLLRRKPGTT